ncbi:MAG: aminotransferase class I/II-fold pyridoxal phosphate-dependent enzyme, partial [Proteobacteria bacterium]|nr:aminotransferase class I/II-fold pyridoxal phosphate-dependent enzyme [Pseudomonadota bacterium]
MRYDLVIDTDECYSGNNTPQSPPPMGLLAACHSAGDTRLQNCLAFYSLSKRSNAPGMRSGFVAGDAHLIKKFLQYRTYHGCTLSLPVQAASIAAWSDEEHVIENRTLYQEKFTAVLEVLKDALP